MTNHTPDVPHKQCSKCKKLLPATTEYFGQRISARPGFLAACKECLNRHTRERRAAYRLPKPEQRPGFKLCRKCKEWKPVGCFHSRVASKDGLAPRCKDCIQTRNLGRQRSKMVDGKKNCTTCGEWLPATTKYFSKAANNPTGLSSNCKNCFRRLYAPPKPKKARAKKNGKATTVACTECGKAFLRLPHEIRKDGIAYCSLQCAAIGKGKRSRGENSPHYSRSEVPCSYCGAPLLRTASQIAHNKKGHFCNGECYGKWRAQNMIGEAATAWNGGKVKVPCLQCGVDVELVPSQVRDPGNFCSQKCYGEWRKDNMLGEDSPIWKGGRLPSYGGSWKKQQRRARKRDKHTCQECGATKEQMGREPDVHHILPFRLFGADRHDEANHLSNLVCLCKRCHGIAELRDYIPGQSE